MTLGDLNTLLGALAMGTVLLIGFIQLLRLGGKKKRPPPLPAAFPPQSEVGQVQPASYCAKCGNAVCKTHVFCARCGSAQTPPRTAGEDALPLVARLGRAQILKK
jgi:hypothetical protein